MGCETNRPEETLNIIFRLTLSFESFFKCIQDLVAYKNKYNIIYILIYTYA